MTVTEEIKQRLDLVALIEANGVQLRKAGRNFTGFCPFHPNARTPAFYVFPHTQSYYCFACHKSGDAFAFLMERQGVTFGDALGLLAHQTGVTLPERTPAQQEAQEQELALHARLRQINEDTAIYWHHVLRSTARGETGRMYVEKRGLAPATVETWQLGYAPEEWGDLLRHLTDRKGYSAEEVEQAGLAIRRENGGFYDRFRNRLMFPIRDLKGAVVGFGGRALGDDHAKYMNTPETPIFHKSSLLFGLHQARDGIRREDSVVIVEGYLDVITAHQAGFANVIAPMGTALTTEHVQLVRKLKLTDRIYLALDADAAGIRAAEKSTESVVETSDPTLVQLGRFDLEWEADLDLPLRIIKLPPGKDPDDVIKADPLQWRALVEGALPIIQFFIDVHTRDLDLSNPEDKYQALTRLMPILTRISDLKLGVYLNDLADHVLRMPYATVRALVLEARQHARRRGPARPMAPPISVRAPAIVQDPYAHEDQLLSLLMRFPEVRGRVEATLAGELQAFPELRDDIPRDLRQVFGRTENRLLWQNWSAHEPAGPLDIAGWLVALDTTLRLQAERLLQWKDEPPLREYAMLADARELANGIAQRIRQSLARRRGDEIKEMARVVEDSADRTRLEYKLDSILKYSNVVKAPRRSTVFPDLGSRRDEFG